MAEPLRPMTVRFYARDLDALKREADRTGVPYQTTIRRLVRKHVEQIAARAARRKGIMM